MTAQSIPIPRQLVLASTSVYRYELLQRLGLPFTTVKPQVDETPQAGESPAALAQRLAQLKARAGAALAPPEAVIIGSDQSAELDGQTLSKPGHRERAAAQLAQLSGRCVVFHTGLCVYDARNGHEQLEVIPYRVWFRPLDAAQIQRYLDREQPYDCTGAFKSERLGIALCERFAGDDPTALIGLPLIRLCRLLEHTGIHVV